MGPTGVSFAHLCHNYLLFRLRHPINLVSKKIRGARNTLKDFNADIINQNLILLDP